MARFPGWLTAAAYAHKFTRRLAEARAEARGMEAARDAFYERVWRAAAEEAGCAIAPLGDGLFEIGSGNRLVRVCNNQSPFDSGITLRVAGDKPLVHRLLARAGVPVPRHVVCTLDERDKAFAFAREIGGPVVVKPASGTGGGVGITANVRGRAALLRAMILARSFHRRVLIEEQLAGDTYRLLYLDGELLDCVVRRPPTLVGDGRSTIARLIQAENEHRAQSGAQAAQGLLWADQDLRRELASQGLSLRSVPEAGRRIRAKRVINDNRGEDNETASLCPAAIEAARRAVAELGARLAGVDVITPDPDRPLDEARGAVIEVNTTPGFYYHYHKKGGPFPVARHVLERALANVGH